MPLKPAVRGKTLPARVARSFPSNDMGPRVWSRFHSKTPKSTHPAARSSRVPKTVRRRWTVQRRSSCQSCRSSASRAWTCAKVRHLGIVLISVEAIEPAIRSRRGGPSR